MHAQATLGYRSEGKPTQTGRSLAGSGPHVDRERLAFETDYLNKAYEDREADLRTVVEKLSVPEGACGVVFAHDGRIVGFDLFDQPSTLAKLWPKLVRAYALDACVARAEAAPSVGRDDVEKWLHGAGERRKRRSNRRAWATTFAWKDRS